MTNVTAGQTVLVHVARVAEQSSSLWRTNQIRDKHVCFETTDCLHTHRTQYGTLLRVAPTLEAIIQITTT